MKLAYNLINSGFGSILALLVSAYGDFVFRITTPEELTIISFFQ